MVLHKHMQKTGITEIIIAMGIVSLLSAGAFGAFGAIAHYLYLIVKSEEQYRMSKMLLFAILGFFVAVVVNEFTEWAFNESYPGLLLVSGFLFWRILDFISESGLGILLNKLNIKKE